MWKVDKGVKVKAGDRAGSLSGTGYIHVEVDLHTYMGHRLAWFYVHGEWPREHIDHINGESSDNRIANLREATRFQNHQNRKKAISNTSGYTGVTWNKQRSKWTAQISVNKQQIHLGYFAEVEDAAAARVKAKAELHTFHPQETRI